MLDIVRTSLHRAIHTPLGDRFLPVRLPKDIARRVNAMLGEPLCSKDELARRRAGRARLEELKRTPADPEATPIVPAAMMQALGGSEVKTARHAEPAVADQHPEPDE